MTEEKRLRILVALLALTFTGLLVSLLGTYVLYRYLQYSGLQLLFSPLAIIIWFFAMCLAGAAFYLDTGISPILVISSWTRLPRFFRSTFDALFHSMEKSHPSIAGGDIEPDVEPVDAKAAPVAPSTPNAEPASDASSTAAPDDAINAAAKLTVARLQDEIRALGRRANLNLLIGIGITITGIGALFVYVWNLGAPKADIKWTDLGAYFLPRASLVALIEIFAYFFLRLYRGNLAEIKFYQNELTNFESKVLALLASSAAGEKIALRTTLTNLGATERNHILKKGETTAELERARLERDQIGDIVKELVSRIGGASGRAGSPPRRQKPASSA